MLNDILNELLIIYLNELLLFWGFIIRFILLKFNFFLGKCVIKNTPCNKCPFNGMIIKLLRFMRV